jgi:hypothetical protein
MTGKPFIKTRVLVSSQFVSPLSGRKDFDEAALAFKKAVLESIRSPRLNAELSVKSAAMSGSIGDNKKNYENSDGKTRTNNGAAPGTVEIAGGYRYKKGAKFEKGKVLQLFPTRDSKASLKKTVNFGWVDDPDVVKPKKPQGRIRIRKFKVNPRTQEAIPESEVEIDTMGNPVAGQSSKQLPGNKIGQSGNLLSRAAGAAGIVVDELGKMRCPPGTPAANQFTDHMGTNCFGLTPGNLVNAVQELASKFALTDKIFKNNEGFLRSFFGAIEADQTTGSNFLGQRFLKRFTGQGRTFWDHYRGVDGEIAPGDIPKWSDVPLTEESRWFVGGMRRAQERLNLQDTRVSGLMDLLGIIRNPESKKQNADLILAFDALAEKGMWDAGIRDRPSHSEVLAGINKRLIDNFPGFSELEPSVQESLRNKDIARYYENERALLETALESFVMNPEHMKQVVVIQFKNDGADEANARALSIEGEDFMGSMIQLDPFEIMRQQESMIPELAPDERLRIDVVGASTDAEAASHLSDFLVTANGHSKQLAAMVEPRAYARHVMKHEIAHTIQIAAFQNKIRESLATNGFIEVIGPDGGVRKVTSIKELTSEDVMDILKSVGDGIDSESLGSVMSKLDNIKFLAGEYPTTFERKGGRDEIWVMEACAELHALRDLGLIYGEDVDSVLEWMDDIADGRHTDRRIRSDIETMKVVEGSYYDSPGPDVGIPESSFDELRVREVAAQKEYIKQIKKNASGFSEQNIVSEIANIEGDIEVLDSRIERMTKDKIDITNITNERDFKIAQKSAFESAWKKKYGVGVPGESKKLQEKVDALRFSESTLSPVAMEERRKALKLKSLKEKADSMSSADLVRQMVDYELKMRQKGVVDADRALLKDESKVFRDRYKNLLAESGDTRGWPAQRRELEKNIDELLRPTKTAVVKDPKSFNNNNSAVDFGNSQRAELLNGKTQRQIDAVQMLSDTEFSSAGQLLDPDKQAMSADAITKRNERLKKLGLPIDPTSRESGSIEEQIENIIIPSMEVMDDSSIGANIEVEAIIDIDVDLETGQILENDIAHEGFVSGRVVTKKQPGLGILSDSEVVDGKKKHRVIIQATETDRGMFPHWSMDVDADDKRDQKLIMPPGKMRVVGRKEDGTIIVQIIEQKNTEDVLSSLTKDGPEGKPWSSSTHKRIEKISDEYLIKRRDGAPLRSNRPIKSVESEDRSILAKREIIASGGNFGEPPSDDYIDEVINGIPSEPDALGSLKNREGRKAERLTRSTKNISDIKKTLSSGANNDIEQIDMDPQVKKIISEKDPAEIIKMVEDAAVEMHAGFDKRPRARMREQELDELVTSGEKRSVVPKFIKGARESSMARRFRRRQEQAFLDKEKQDATATEAAKKFNSLKDSGLGNGGLDNIDDATLLREHGLVRSKQKSVLSDKPIYIADSADDAIALLALGYEVEVRNTGERKMVKNAALETEAKLIKIAELEATNLELTGDDAKAYVKDFMEKHDIDLCGLYNKKQNVFCSEHININRQHMPQSAGPPQSSESIAARAMVSGLIGGDFKPVGGLSEDDAKRYKKLAKAMKNPKGFAEVQESDREWVLSKTDWTKSEPGAVDELYDFLRSALGGDDKVVRKSIDADDLVASQKQLRNSQIDGQAENIAKLYLEARKGWGKAGTPEFMEKRQEWLSNVDEAWFQNPTVTTSKDGFIVDGHHRWAAIKLFNDSVPQEERLKVEAFEVQTNIHEALLLSKTFQEHFQIKGKSVGKTEAYKDNGEILPISKEDLDASMQDLKDNFPKYAKEIIDKGIYPVTVDDLSFKPVRNEPRSPGLKDNRDRSVREYGMEWKPAYSEIESVEASKKWDGWDDVPLTEVDLSSIDIRPTESHLKGESIDKVVEGREAFREGYHPNLIIDVDGNMYISDGHNRVAMNRALDNNKIQARVIDLRKVEEPWKDGSPDKKNYKGYDLVEPKNPYPKPGDSGVMPTDEEISAAAAQREKLVDIEKEITSTLIDASDKHGGIMIGLAYRFKSVKAMAGKINRERGDRTAQQAAEEMSDVIRYTTTFTPENYVAGARATIDDLQAAGYQLTVKNYWKSGDPYQGINIAAIHPNGTRFELQFHTPQSAVEKDKIHKDYEEYRTELDPDKRRKIYDRMVRLAEAIDIPVESEALLTLGELREQSYEDHPSAVSSVVPKIAKAGSSLSSGGNKGNLSPRVIENTTKLEERSTKAKERVVNLEKALDALRRTGEWRGEEFGAIVSVHNGWTSDIEKFDADTTPINLTKEEVEKRFGSVSQFVNSVQDKLDRSRMEAAHSEYFAKSKQTRIEQNTIDVEDLMPEDFQLLLNEYEQLTPEDYDDAVVHGGQPELEGGILDPSKTTGDKDGIGDAGNTGALNLRTLQLQREEQSRAEETASTWKAVMQSFIEDKKTYKPKTRAEADLLNAYFRISTSEYSTAERFVIGEDFDLTEFLPKKDAFITELTRFSQDEERRANVIAERFALMGEGEEFGFLSSYPASKEIVTGGYFGRNSGSVVPVDVAKHLTEFEADRRGDSRRQFEDIKDRDMLRRWQLALRGTAYLITDKKKIARGLGPDEERQILGKAKPVIGVSAPVRGYNPLTSDDAKQKEWGKVASAIMARAVRLEKEGKEVNLENILAARRGEPLPSGQSLSSGADMAVGSRNAVRRGSAIENYRHEYQSRIGIHDETPESARPVSGYLVHKSHIDKKKNMVKQSGSGNHGQDAIFELEDNDVVGDGLTALGEIEVVLRPEVGSRTAYGIGESINTAHRPVMLTSNNRDDISDALTNTHGVESSQRNVDSMIHLLSAGIDKDFTKVGARRDGNGRMAPVGKMDPSTDRAHEPFEAQILGGFKRDDVEGIHYPFSRIQKLSEQEEVQDAIPEKTITAKLTKLGFTKEEIAYFYSMSNGQPLTGASVQKLKEYRAAKKIKKKYESQGIGYVKFAHPKGINIENPKTYDKLAKGNEDVEKIIIGQILSEMEASMKAMLAKMRKNKANSMLGDPS